MNARPFDQVARTLRECVTAHYLLYGLDLESDSAQLTVATNSDLVERRGAPLLRAAAEGRSLDGLEVLDLGCGFGALSALFAWNGARVTGVDANGERLAVGREVAARHGLDAAFQRGQFGTLTLPARSFDAIVYNNSFCYLVGTQDRRKALAEAWSLLRPGGTVLMRNPNRWHPRDQFTGLPLVQLLPPLKAMEVAQRAGRPRSAVRLTSPPAAARELRRAGFEKVRSLPSGSGARAALRPVARYQHVSGRRPA